MKKIRVHIVDVSEFATLKGPSYLRTDSERPFKVVLEDSEMKYSIPILVTAAQAQIINIGNNYVQTRPFAHDLIVSIVEKYTIDIKEVIITELDEKSMFYIAEIHCEDSQGKKVVLDARPSDALAVAVRLSAPIFINQTLVDDIQNKLELLKDTSSENEKKSSEHSSISKIEDAEEIEETILEVSNTLPINELSIKDLQELLQKALEDEDYEVAAKVRDEINNRS